MARRDIDTRTRLASSGVLAHGYHPEMRAVHEANAVELSVIIEAHGWPDTDLVGEDAAEAAWLIVQHAISRPDLVRAVLPLLTAAVDRGVAPPAQLAMLADRVCFFEGRPQRYGTQFDWDDEGRLSPIPIEDESHVDERRAEVGLEPMSVVTRRHREAAGPPPSPEQLKRRRVEAASFAREVGWRNSPDR